MSLIGYFCPSRPCPPDGEFTPNSGHRHPNVGNRPADFRVAPRFGCARWSLLTENRDPSTTLDGSVEHRAPIS